MQSVYQISFFIVLCWGEGQTLGASHRLKILELQCKWDVFLRMYIPDTEQSLIKMSLEDLMKG